MNQEIQQLSGIIVDENNRNKQIMEDNDIYDMDNHYYGQITPFSSKVFGKGYYSNPQNYMLCFTTLLTSGMSVVLLMYVFQGYHLYVGIILCLYAIYTLLTLGFSNPGLGFQDYQKWQFHYDTQSCTQKCRHSPTLQQEFGYYCNKCSIPTKRNTRHCQICGVCIYEHDHHCIFIGKCVGGKNMGKFKQFLCIIFFTLIYGLVTTIYSINHAQKVKPI